MLSRDKGFSLIELLIALLLGSMLLAMVISLYVTSVSGGVKNLHYSRLRTDLQSIVSLMESDIRRAGYGGPDYMVGSGASKTVDSINSEDKDCIVYYYNHDDSTSIENANKMGFRLNPKTHEIQFGTGVAPLALNCYDAGYWRALTDKRFIQITALAFTESSVSSAAATLRSVQIEITGQLVSESAAQHTVKSKVQVRNLEFN